MGPEAAATYRLVDVKIVASCPAWPGHRRAQATPSTPTSTTIRASNCLVSASLTGKGLGDMRECWKWEEFPHFCSPRAGECMVRAGERDYIGRAVERFPCCRLCGAEAAYRTVVRLRGPGSMSRMLTRMLIRVPWVDAFGSSMPGLTGSQVFSHPFRFTS